MAFLQAPRDRAAFLILVLGVGIVLALTPFLSGLLGAAVLYVIFQPPFRRLCRVMKPGGAAAITLGGALLLVAIPAAWLVGVVIDQAPDALRTLQSSALFARVNTLRIGSFEVGAELARASGSIVSWLSAQLVAFVGGATSAALNLVIAFFGLYYMLRSGTQVWSVARGYIPFSSETSDALRDRFFGVTEATLLGTGFVALVQGALIGIGFAAVGLPNPLFWATVTAFASILPVLGSALVWVPGMIVLLGQGRFGAAVVILVIGGGLASNIDNLVRPIIYKRVSNLHPMITLVGAFAGVRYFGLLGLLLGPLAIAYLFELLFFYRQEYGAIEEARSVSAPSGVTV